MPPGLHWDRSGPALSQAAASLCPSLLGSEAFVNPVPAIQGPGVSLKTARIKTTGPKHALGILTRDSTSASPSGDSGTASVVATTLPPVRPQPKLALTLLTGPGVPRLTRIKPAISTRSRPSPVKAAEPRWTVQGAPPLGTPPITVLGFDPIIVERNRNSSASAPSTNTPASKPAKRTALVRILFIFYTLLHCM